MSSDLRHPVPRTNWVQVVLGVLNASSITGSEKSGVVGVSLRCLGKVRLDQGTVQSRHNVSVSLFPRQFMPNLGLLERQCCHPGERLFSVARTNNRPPACLPASSRSCLNRLTMSPGCKPTEARKLVPTGERKNPASSDIFSR